MPRFTSQRLVCITVLVLTLGAVATAQEKTETAPTITLQGIINSVNKKPLPAHVAIIGRDSTVQRVVQADSLGHYMINQLAAGFHQLRFSHVGYSTVTKFIRLTGEPAQIVVNINLNSITAQLAEITVRDRASYFSMDGDRIRMNIEQNPSVAGLTVLEALNFAPRVETNPATKALTIDGKTGVLLYINGRQHYINPGEISQFLQGLSVNAISRLEILTSPPASYDAGGNAVISLYTRGLGRAGISGDVSASVGVGRYPKADITLTGNFSGKKLQGTLLVNPSYRPTYYSWVNNQILTNRNSQLPGYSQSNEFNYILTKGIQLRSNLDWLISKRTTLGIVGYWTGSDYSENPGSQLIYQLASPLEGQSPSMPMPVSIHAQSTLDKLISNGTVNVNFRHVLDKAAKHSLSLDVDVGSFRDDSRSFASFSQLQNGILSDHFLHINYPNRVDFKTAKVDFTSSFSGNGRLETGIKHSSINMENVPQPFTLTDDFSELETKLLTLYRYKERTLSAYISVSKQWKQITFQSGLRLEHTAYQGQSQSILSGSRTTYERRYANLFPSLSFTYMPNRVPGQFTFSMASRIVRPAFHLLNPAYLFIDPLTLYSGNPLLQPERTTSIQIGYSTPKKISVALMYSRTADRIREVVYRMDSTQATTLDYSINFDWEKRLSLTLTWPFQITKGWSMQAVLTGSYASFYSTFLNTETRTSQPSVLARLHHRLTLNKWTATLSLTARSRAVVGFMSYRPYWYIDAGLQHPVGRKGMLKLAASDLFHTLLITNYGSYLNTNIEFRHRYESQQVHLTYSHPLGNPKNKKFSERSLGSDNEQERLKGATK